MRPASADEKPRASAKAPFSWRSACRRPKRRRWRDSVDGRTLVLGADTVVALEDALLGKPADADEAIQMLNSLRGRTHEVITALTLVADDGAWLGQEVCRTPVPMRDYAAAGRPGLRRLGRGFDKAGAYGIQDRTFDPVDVQRMNGCYANVMGLPLCHLVRLMRRRDLRPDTNVPAACQAHTGYRCGVYAEILGTNFMRRGWAAAILLGVLLAGCSLRSGPRTPEASPELPTPVTTNVPAPDPEVAARLFLDAWARSDFAAMYARLSPLSQDSQSRRGLRQVLRRRAPGGGPLDGLLPDHVGAGQPARGAGLLPRHPHQLGGG